MPEKRTAEMLTLNDNSISDTENTISDHAYHKLFKYLADIQKKYKTNIIIFYHPSEILNQDGSITFEPEDGLEAFALAAEEYGIQFINMESDFENMYYEEYHVPHGFITGRLGAGHLNKFGHAAAADAVYDTIIKLEED